MSSVPQKADKLNISLSAILHIGEIDFGVCSNELLEFDQYILGLLLVKLIYDIVDKN